MAGWLAWEALLSQLIGLQGLPLGGSFLKWEMPSGLLGIPSSLALGPNHNQTQDMLPEVLAFWICSSSCSALARIAVTVWRAEWVMAEGA